MHVWLQSNSSSGPCTHLLELVDGVALLLLRRGKTQTQQALRSVEYNCLQGIPALNESTSLHAHHPHEVVMQRPSHRAPGAPLAALHGCWQAPGARGARGAWAGSRAGWVRLPPPWRVWAALPLPPPPPVLPLASQPPLPLQERAARPLSPRRLAQPWEPAQQPHQQPPPRPQRERGGRLLPLPAPSPPPPAGTQEIGLTRVNVA